MTVNLYEYCLGHGIAAWEISTEPHKIRVTDFALDPTNISLEVGDTAHLQAIITPANATEQDITWRYSPTNRATRLTKNGLTATLTSTKEGTYTVTASLGDRTATCEVTVTTPTSVQNITTTKISGKYLEDGQIHIVSEGNIYNVHGQTNL